MVDVALLFLQQGDIETNPGPEKETIKNLSCFHGNVDPNLVVPLPFSLSRFSLNNSKTVKAVNLVFCKILQHFITDVHIIKAMITQDFKEKTVLAVQVVAKTKEDYHIS